MNFGKIFLNVKNNFDGRNNMNGKINQPEALLTLTDLEALKTIADPLRNQIMEALTPEPLTVGQIAGLLGVEKSKLYYHISQLEKYDFIRVVDTTQRGNLIEKHYWITAYAFDIDEGMFNFNVDTPEGTEAITTLLLANLDATREDLVRSLTARHQQIAQGAPQQPRPVIDHRKVFNISDEKAEQFQARLKILLEEFTVEESLDDPKERQSWALGVFMYPRFYFPQGKNSNENSFEG
jgi:DNA-binding MarR family transcriptional regulator